MLQNTNGKIQDAERVALHEYFDGTVNLRKATAERWLRELNSGNRHVRPSNLVYLKRLIEAGEFDGEHPQPIVFDENGNLADGQHRLTALVKSEVDSVKIHLRCGMPARLREHIDRGIPRSLCDVVLFVDQPTLNLRISTIISTWWYLESTGGSVGKITPELAHGIFDTHKESITWAGQLFMSTQRGVTRAPVCVALAQLYERDFNVALTFSSVLLDKTGELSGCQPARKLRDFLLSMRSSGGMSINIEIHRKAVHCMKAALAGQNVNKITGQTW